MHTTYLLKPFPRLLPARVARPPSSFDSFQLLVLLRRALKWVAQAGVSGGRGAGWGRPGGGGLGLSCLFRSPPPCIHCMWLSGRVAPERRALSGLLGGGQRRACGQRHAVAASGRDAASGGPWADGRAAASAGGWQAGCGPWAGRAAIVIVHVQQ
jgi:hypothetical protein